MANSSSDYNSRNYKDLALVPETVLKKRHDLDELRRKKAAQEQLLQAKTKGSKDGKKTFFVKRLETFVARGRNERNNGVRYKRVMKKGMQKRASNKAVTSTRELTQDYYDDDDDEDRAAVREVVSYQSNSVGSPMVFVVRIRDHFGTPQSVRRTLGALRLKNENDGVFLRYDESKRKALHLVEPWVVYGRPSEAVISDLIERRGFGKVDGKRVPLADNTVIEKALEESNIICKEDLVHELHTVGDGFNAATKFLWPFKLSHSKNRFERDVLELKRGKDYGDKGEAIDEYIRATL